MAKVFKSNLPKNISVANKEISTLIESDIASESKVLKGLVDQVLKANIEVKKKNNARITETKRRINELDTEISKLNISIDDVDRDTVIRQLNEMIEAENKIYNARQDIRFYDILQANDKLEVYQEANLNIVTKTKEMYDFEKAYQTKLHTANNNLFDKQYDITSKITALMDEMFKKRGASIITKLHDFGQIEERIQDLEFSLLADLNKQISVYYNINSKATASFKETVNAEDLAAEIEETYHATITNLEKELESSESEHKELIKQLLADLELERKRIYGEVYEGYAPPVAEKDMKTQKLHSIRLQIMDAEKKNNLVLVSKLLRQFDKVENAQSKVPKDKKSQEFHKKFAKVEKDFKSRINQATIAKIRLVNAIEFQLEDEKINYDESKILYKIKKDRDSLSEYLGASKDHVEALQETLSNKLNSVKDIYNMKRDLRISELEVIKSNELMELELEAEYFTLLKGIKELEHERKTTIVEDINVYDALKVNQKELIKKDIELIKLNREVEAINKVIVEQVNQQKIKTENIKEDATSEIIYQKSLLEIAKKEHELQIIKVKSLYENEKTLAEDQINRISIGIKVNDAFVKTTLNNQLSFANQQIKLAESEFDIRVESINLTRQQELNYATKKIDLFMHKYEYEKSKIEKQRDAQLEDLKYKLLLFRDEKENKDIQTKIDKLKNEHNDIINNITIEEKSDPEIIRYKKVIDEANNRAQEAVNEAELVKSQTIASFIKMREETIQKFDSLILSDSNESSNQNIPVVNNNVISSSEERLQKAIKEAGELYADKIQEPQKTIELNNDILENAESNDSLNEFIKELEERKTLFKDKYDEAIELIDKEKTDKIAPLDDLVVKARAIKTMELDYLQDQMFDSVTYREESAILEDYELLLEKELGIHQQKETKIEQSISNQLASFVTLQNKLSSDISKTISKYDSYIKIASKDLRKQKKAIVKEYKADLKSKLQVTK